MNAPELPDTDAAALLYGHDPTERVVALHLADRGRMRVYRRLADDTVVHEDEPFHPFFLLDDIEHLRGFPRDRFQFQELTDANAFGHLVVFPDLNAYWDALRHVRQSAETEKARPDAVYLVGSPEQPESWTVGVLQAISFESNAAKMAPMCGVPSFRLPLSSSAAR